MKRYTARRRPPHANEPADRPAVAIAGLILMLGLAICFLLPMALSGCTADGKLDMDALRFGAKQSAAEVDAVQKTIVDVQARRDKLAVDAAQLPVGPQKEKAAAAVAEADKLLAQLKAGQKLAAERLADFNERLKTATDEVDVFLAALQSAAPAIPQPWGTFLLLGTNLATAVYAGVKRAASNRNLTAGQAVVRALEAAKTPEGVVNFTDPATAKALSAVMGEAGKALVDGVQGPKTPA